MGGRTSRLRCPSRRMSSVRLWAISDIHTDIKENLAWIESISDTDFLDDALIVAGDVSDSHAVLERTLAVLKRKFADVFFVPGNHDLWVDGDDTCVDKVVQLQDLCRRLSVHSAAARVGTAEKGVWVCPILSWHHQSWDPEPDLEGWKVPSVAECMVDYERCRFPPGVSMFDDSAARRIDKMNEALGLQLPLADRPSDEALVTFSHFLPRIELSLEKRYLALPCLPKASGSNYLRKRVEELKPEIHVFGHTHFGWDAVHDGVRYVQAALGYPHEREMRWPSLANAAFGEAHQPLLLWSSDGGFAPKTRCRWSGFYEHHGRDPERVWELASYTARNYRKTHDKAKECMPDFSFW
ncbi:unnamed protein product [Symbiodinium sp. CCMP2456]|nr:unnamed protein product [Symbiodinium sp. CCMP2456]